MTDAWGQSGELARTVLCSQGHMNSPNYVVVLVAGDITAYLLATTGSKFATWAVLRPIPRGAPTLGLIGAAAG